MLAKEVERKFEFIEKKALFGFREEEKELLTALLTRVHENMSGRGDVCDE